MQRADAERLADVEAKRAREGAVAELSAMRAGLEADRARLAEATARAEVARASADLASAIGVPIAALPPVVAMTTLLPAAVPLPEPPSAIAAAVTRRSDLASRRAGVVVARLHLSASRRALLPSVELQAGTKQTAGYATRTFGVAIPLPLLDRNAGARESAAAAVRLAEAELRAAELATSAEVTAAIDALRALSDARAPAADSLAARAAEVARVADAAYAAGGGSLLELLDARRARADALTAALRWTAELRLARLELNRSSGAPLLQDLETP
jgi:cobalt-zinc-cadmium efflux system outer membrane protein